MLIMVEFIEDLLNKVKESSKLDLFLVKDNLDKDLFISQESHFTTSAMVQVETAILCTHIFYSDLIKEELLKVEIDLII